jgi:hypothetical protein
MKYKTEIWTNETDSMEMCFKNIQRNMTIPSLSWILRMLTISVFPPLCRVKCEAAPFCLALQLQRSHTAAVVDRKTLKDGVICHSATSASTLLENKVLIIAFLHRCCHYDYKRWEQQIMFSYQSQTPSVAHGLRNGFAIGCPCVRL